MTLLPVLQARFGFVLAALLGGIAQGATAAPLDLTFPGPSVTTASRIEAMTSFRLPVGPYQQGAMTTAMAEGPLTLKFCMPSVLVLISFRPIEIVSPSLAPT